MKKIILFLFLAVITLSIKAQNNSYLEVGGGIGSSTASFGGAFHKNWTLGKKGRFIIGTGVRFTGFAGSDQYFTTAPADLTADEKNIDSLFAPKPALYGLNVLINLGYRFSNKLEVGFNIDAVGLSFGPTGSPSYIRNGGKTTAAASPSKVNLLLVGDNDKGSLNSHFYAKYNFSQKIGIKVAYQYLLNELTTTTKVQTIPSANDRFRLKSSMIYAGITFGL